MEHKEVAYIDERSLSKKITGSLKRVGKATIGLVLTMYFTAKDKNTPKIVKTAIYTSLAYFILPIDSIPDFIPGIGFSDDITLLTATFSIVAAHIKDEHISQANEKISKYIKIF